MYLFYIDALNSLCLFGFSEDDRAYKKASIMVDCILMLEMAKQYQKKNFSYPFPLSKGKSLIAL